MLISSSNNDFCSSVSFDTHFSLLKEDVVDEEEAEEEEGWEEVKKEVIDLAFLTVVAAVVDWASDSGALRLVFEVEEDMVDLGYFYLLVFFGRIGDGVELNGGIRRRRGKGKIISARGEEGGGRGRERKEKYRSSHEFSRVTRRDAIGCAMDV